MPVGKSDDAKVMVNRSMGKICGKDIFRQYPFLVTDVRVEKSIHGQPHIQLAA